MNELTMGQRIAARRKLLNLSQEALAEHLGISRQAVSKWEADAAIPEIDKLIALSKLYGVSVGWLLGVEEQESVQSDTLSESQLKMVEEIVRRYQAPQRKRALWKAVALVLCIGIAIAALFHYTRQQNNLLATENAAIQSQIAELSAGNADIQVQIDKIDALLSAQSETSKLLRSYVPLCHLNDDLETVDITFYFFPRVYHENVTACLSILNPAAGVNEMLECRWVHDRYLVNTTLPLADHYQYSFLLVSETGYGEEILAGNTYYSDLLAHSGFYIAEDDPKYSQIMSRESAPVAADETVYSFNTGLYIPCIQERNGYVPFRDVTITLTHNDQVIWHRDYSDQLLNHYSISDNKVLSDPFYPDIQVDLPELREGDRLILELTATTHTNRTMITRLDDLTVENP